MTAPGQRIEVAACGGADVLEFRDFDVAAICGRDVLVSNAAVGVNYIDVYHRTGLYPRVHPFVPGVEGAGTVVQVGPEVSRFKPGDRVAYVGPYGSYSTHTVVPEHRLVEIPTGITDAAAATGLLQGLTAHALLHLARPVSAGETIMVHAAAGGVGTLITQWGRALGARVIAGTSTEDKAVLARSEGADSTVITVANDWVRDVMRLTEDRGVDVVYDSVGRETFQGSLAILTRRGTLVSFGQSSGPPPPVDVVELGQRGSLTITRPSVFDFIATEEQLADGADAVFQAMRERIIMPRITDTRPLSDAAAAHRAIESRRTTGSLLLLP